MTGFFTALITALVGWPLAILSSLLFGFANVFG